MCSPVDILLFFGQRIHLLCKPGHLLLPPGSRLNLYYLLGLLADRGNKAINLLLSVVRVDNNPQPRTLFWNNRESHREGGVL